MNLDLIAMMTILIIMSLFGMGILLYLLIRWSDQLNTPEEQEYEDKEQIEYLRKYNEKKYKK